MHKTIPIFIFVLAMIVVFGSVGLRIWSFDIQKDIDSEVQALNKQQSENEERLVELNKNLATPIVVMEMKKTGQYPTTTCTDTGLIPKCTVKWLDIKTKVPVVKGTKIDPKVQQEIDTVKNEISDLTNKIQGLSEKKMKIEKVAYLDKESLRGLLSLLITIASLFIILSKSYHAESEKWAFGAIGTVMGYWFG